MKIKKMFIVIIILSMLFFSGCTTMKDDNPDVMYGGTFTVVDSYRDECGALVRILVDNQTKVMYYYVAFGSGNYRNAGMSVIYNPDGTVKLYEE